MSIGIRLAGLAGRRGLIPRLPTPQALADDLEGAIRRESADALEELDRTNGDDGTIELRARFHPAAEPVVVQLDVGGRIRVGAVTTGAGPGYHTWLCQLLHRLGAEASIEWLRPEADPGSRDDTGFFWSDVRADVERAHLVWLRDVLRAAAVVRERRSETVHLGAFDGHRFDVDGALATVLGPRDDAWLAEALERPAVAADVWPWSADALDARYGLLRATALMWTAVRWRAPATDDERAVVDEVLRLLRRSFPLDPSLPWPWREWRELLQLAAVSTDPTTDRVAREAAALEARNGSGGSAAPLIGYRRRPVTILHEGWQLTIPGSWAERRAGGEWWGGEGGRSVTLAAVETGEDGAPMPRESFLERFAAQLGPDALVHRDGPLRGKARVAIDVSSGVEVATLEGYSAVPGSGAAIRVEIHDPGDWEWALDLWRSLAPATATRPAAVAARR